MLLFGVAGAVSEHFRYSFPSCSCIIRVCVCVCKRVCRRTQRKCLFVHFFSYSRQNFQRNRNNTVHTVAFSGETKEMRWSQRKNEYQEHDICLAPMHSKNIFQHNDKNSHIQLGMQFHFRPNVVHGLPIVYRGRGRLK